MQLQVFHGKAEGDIDVRMMVVWDGDAVVEHGSVDAMREKYPHAVERVDLDVRLALRDLVGFEVKIGSPIKEV